MSAQDFQNAFQEYLAQVGTYNTAQRTGLLATFKQDNADALAAAGAPQPGTCHALFCSLLTSLLLSAHKRHLTRSLCCAHFLIGRAVADLRRRCRCHSVESRCCCPGRCR